MDKGDQGNCADVVFQVPRGLKTVIEVSKGQQGNVLLRHFKNRGWTFAETDPDFVIGERACVVFVSLKYHLLQPEYVKTRISELQCFDICIVLCLIDAEDVFATLHSINRAAGMGASSPRGVSSLLLKPTGPPKWRACHFMGLFRV